VGHAVVPRRVPGPVVEPVPDPGLAAARDRWTAELG
jgi:hypothetical protein